MVKYSELVERLGYYPDVEEFQAFQSEDNTDIQPPSHWAKARKARKITALEEERLRVFLCMLQGEDTGTIDPHSWLGRQQLNKPLWYTKPKPKKPGLASMFD